MLNWITSHTQLLAILLGVAAGYPLMYRRRERLGLRGWWQTLVLCLVFTAFSVLCALLFASFEGLLGGKGWSFGAVSTYGCYLFCPLLLFLTARLTKRELRSVFDLYALYAVPSLFLLRINCIYAGCCSGLPIHGTALHWPTRETELVFYVVIFIVLLRREARDAKPGTAFPLLLGSYGAFRFVNEWFRVSDSGRLLHLTHLWCVLAAAIGFAIYLELAGKRSAGPVYKRAGRKAS